LECPTTTTISASLYLQNLRLLVFRLPGTRDKTPLGAVPQLSAFDGSEARSERAEQQGGRQPERELGGTAPRLIGRSLGLRDDIIDALFRIGLAHTRLSGDQLGNISSVTGRQPATSGIARRPKPKHLGTRGSTRTCIGASTGRCGRSSATSRSRIGRWGFTPEKSVDINLRGIGGRLTRRRAGHRGGAAEQMSGRGAK